VFSYFGKDISECFDDRSAQYLVTVWFFGEKLSEHIPYRYQLTIMKYIIDRGSWLYRGFHVCIHTGTYSIYIVSYM